MLIRRAARDLVLNPERGRCRERFPEKFEIPEVPSNVMLITIYALCLFAQWTVHAAKRGDRVHVGLSLGIVAVMTLAFINAQAYVYHAMEMPIADSAYPGMFYAITGTMLALVIIVGLKGRHRVPDARRSRGEL